jgi:cell division protein FtsN
MQDPSKDVRPRDRTIGKRTILLGAMGFLAFAFLCTIGYLVSIHAHQSQPQDTVVMNSTPPPGTPAVPLRMPPAVRTPPPAAIDPQIKERMDAEANGTNAAGDQPDADVQQNGQNLTMKLDNADNTPDGAAGSQAAQAQSADAGTDAKQKPVRDTSPKRSTMTSDKTLYRVQAGTFSNKSNADALAADLKNHGYKPEVKSVQVEDRTGYRVQLGEYKTHEDAQAVANDLTSDGYQPSIVTVPGSD